MKKRFLLVSYCDGWDPSFSFHSSVKKAVKKALKKESETKSDNWHYQILDLESMSVMEHEEVNHLFFLEGQRILLE